MKRGPTTNAHRTLMAAMLVGALAGAGTRAASAQPQDSPSPGAAAASSNGAELAKKLSNPIANLISAPVQMNFDYGFAGGDGFKFVANVQPVIPISISRDWNVISRTILPLTYQSHVVDDGRQGGLGDTLQSLFFSPKEPTSGGIVWGVGPALLFPTATDESLGGKKWAAGPTFVVLTQKSGWTVGMLANQLWSYAGDSDRAEINALFVQPFVARTTKTLTTFTLNTESTYNWKAAKDRWSVPLNFTVAQLMRFGKQPVQLAGGLRYWAASPENGASGWGYRVVVTLLFPK
ncbi:MAG TPA: transporter [Thermoanaerobaculia bacterium]|nr:transporter [Thermoanaerobaculia bacterium]